MYFVTICTHNRQALFGQIVDGVMIENAYSQMVRQVWQGLPQHYPHVRLDAFVMMPNHLHGIVVLDDVGICADRVGLKPTPTCSVNISENEVYDASLCSNHAQIDKIDETVNPVGAGFKPARPRHGLPEIVRALKPFQHERLTKRVARPTPLSGNETIMNTSFAQMNHI